MFKSLLVTFVALLPSSVLAMQMELDSAQVIEPVQPSAGLIERIEAQPSLQDDGVELLDQFDRGVYPYRLSTVLMRDGLPYYPYYALREGSQHVVHPMALGRFLLRNAEGTGAERSIQAAVDIAHELPNGGLAWYYPRHYQVARMLGPHLKYSSISQGTILSGLTGAAVEGVVDMELARRTFDALLWPFEQGGVNLADRAVLEMPSFAGPPEIILNGWIDALIHIRDYAQISGDVQAMDFFRANLSFLAEILPNFDAREHRISRYSDVSPYRVKVTLGQADDVNTLQVLYRPLNDILPSIRVPLERTEDPDNFSPYENQILRQNGREAFVWVSCSQLYETVIISQSSEMSVAMASGEVNRYSTTPGHNGQDISLESSESGGYRFVELSAGDDLICGYPTNFSKGGTHNYYHVYHIVGLLLLATSEEISDNDARTLIEWALRWKEDMEYISSVEGLEFRGLQDMLEDINANQSLVRHESFEALLDDAMDIVQ